MIEQLVVYLQDFVLVIVIWFFAMSQPMQFSLLQIHFEFLAGFDFCRVRLSFADWIGVHEEFHDLLFVIAFHLNLSLSLIFQVMIFQDMICYVLVCRVH